MTKCSYIFYFSHIEYICKKKLMEIAIGIIGLFIAWLTYHKTFNSTPDASEEKNNLLSVFKATQMLHLDVQLLLEKYINENDAANDELFPNTTFHQYLIRSKQEFEKSLSDKVYQELKSKNFTKSNIASLLKLIEFQNINLAQLKTHLMYLN